MYKEVVGDLIRLAKEGEFDVIAHGCNCFCTMGAGIAPQMALAFGCNNFPMERIYDTEIGLDGLTHPIETNNKGNINKLGNIDYKTIHFSKDKGHIIGAYTLPKPDNIFDIIVVNAYTQYKYGRNHKDGVSNPVDYEAITLCMRKMNQVFKGKHIGLPLIGCGLAGGDWNRIQKIIQEELKDCDVTIVIFEKN